MRVFPRSRARQRGQRQDPGGTPEATNRLVGGSTDSTRYPFICSSSELGTLPIERTHTLPRTAGLRHATAPETSLGTTGGRLPDSPTRVADAPCGTIPACP